MEGQDLTKGSIKKELWSIAWPLMLSFFFYTLYNIVDAFWVSKLSADAIAAVSVSQVVLMIMISLGMGLTVGSGVIMAMHIGAKNKDEAERVLGQSFVLAAIAGMVFTAISIMWRSELLVLSGATGTIFAPALEYFTITAGGSILIFLLITVMFAFNSQGDTHTLTKFFAFSTLVNTILDPIMIFGWGGFPALGIAGAAWATLISEAVFIVLALRSLAKPHRGIRFHFRNLTLKWESVKKVLNIGFPASITQVISPLGLAGLMYITALGFHEAGTTAFSLGFRLEFFAILPAIGFGFGSMALIGQNLGAGNLERARASFRLALAWSAAGAAAFGVLAILFSDVLISIFTHDTLVTDYTLSYLLIVGLTYGFMAAALTEASAFQAIGRSWPGFWIFFFRFVIVSLPIAYVLTQVYALPVEAVWAALALGNVLSGIVGYLWITRAMRTLKLSEVPVHSTPPAA